MSQILVIEPNRTLQQAIALSLFPDHETRVAASLAEIPGQNFDVVIVDAASLREGGGIDAEGIRRILSWNLPTIWIEEGGGPERPARPQLIVIERPLRNTALQAALKECLDFSSKSSRHKEARMQEAQPPGVVGEKSRARSVDTIATPPDCNVIELVDVVAEGSEPEVEKTNK